jgi:hypothetical protein
MSYDNEDLKFFYPEEGTNVFVDAMCIPKSSKNKEVAKEYINFMLSEEAAVANAIYNGYASPNTLVQNSEEYREEIQKGTLTLSESDFVTDFHRNVFSAIMRMHGESGFYYELLGERFSPDEMGRIKKMEVARQQLVENGREVLVSAIETLHASKTEAESKNTDLATRLAYLRDKKTKIHKGKADTQ